MPLEEKEENLSKRGKTCRLQSQNGVDYGGLLGAGTIKQEEKGSCGNCRWAGEPERGRWYETLMALNRKPMVNNVQPKYRNTLRGTYAGNQYYASGRQRGILIPYTGPTGAINGMSKIDNVRSRRRSNSLTASLAESSAQRKRWKNKYAKIQERRQRKRKKSSDENNDNAGSIHDATERLRRGKRTRWKL